MAKRIYVGTLAQMRGDQIMVIHCEDHHCRHSVVVDLDHAVEVRGADTTITAYMRGRRCRGCGGDDLSLSCPPDTDSYAMVKAKAERID